MDQKFIHGGAGGKPTWALKRILKKRGVEGLHPFSSEAGEGPVNRILVNTECQPQDIVDEITASQVSCRAFGQPQSFTSSSVAGLLPEVGPNCLDSKHIPLGFLGHVFFFVVCWFIRTRENRQFQRASEFPHVNFFK